MPQAPTVSSRIPRGFDGVLSGPAASRRATPAGAIGHLRRAAQWGLFRTGAETARPPRAAAGIVARRGRMAFAVLALACAIGAVLAGCRPAGVEGKALDFTGETLVKRAPWDTGGLPARWVRAAASDAELEDLLAGTATAPRLPAGQTALLYYVGGGSPPLPYEATGVYGDGGEWTLAVRRYKDDLIRPAVYTSTRYLVFVDGPVPERVRLRFEDQLVDGEPEVTWW